MKSIIYSILAEKAMSRGQMVKTSFTEKLFLLLCVAAVVMILFLSGCGGSSSSPAVNVTDPVTPVTPVNPVDPVTPVTPIKNNILLVFYDNTTVKFYDGTEITTWKTGQAIPVTGRKIILDGVLNTLDTTGNILSIKTLPVQPSFFITNGTDEYIVYNVPPAEAEALGATYNYFTRVYKNGVETGTWNLRMYQTTAVAIVNGELLLYAKYMNGWHGTEANINAVMNGEFLIYNYSQPAHTATINGVSVTWVTNWLDNADEWIKYNSKYYSENGYIWDGATLQENVTVLWSYRSDVLIAVGCYTISGETGLYFIDCSTGWLLKYNPALNTITNINRLYDGDGTWSMGSDYKTLLHPVISADCIYFQFSDGGIYCYNFSTGLVSMIATSGQWIKAW